MSAIAFRFNPMLDVVSAQLPGTEVVRARPAPSDNRLVLELDAKGRVVGVELISPTHMRRAFWQQHPDRSQVPQQLLKELDAWLEELWSHEDASK